MSPELHGRLMDFGCGSKPYKTLFHNTEYIGVDFEGEGHSHAQESIDVYYDGKTIPFPDAHFDSIFSSEVFEHIFNLPDIIKELNRVLKIEGRILVTCPFSICEHEVPIDYARYTSFALRHLLESHGFEIVSQIKTGSYITTLAQHFNLYWDQCIMKFIRRIPILRSIVRLTVYPLINTISLLLIKILPDSKDLYLNNIVLARKIKDL
jgi:SAM-dependent methyltransferase